MLLPGFLPRYMPHTASAEQHGVMNALCSMHAVEGLWLVDFIQSGFGSGRATLTLKSPWCGLLPLSVITRSEPLVGCKPGVPSPLSAGVGICQ